MEKDRNVKIIAIAALLVAVIGVSLGFAAFTQTLTITPTANVDPEDTFSVKFSKVNSAVTAGAIENITTTGGAVVADQSASVAAGNELTNITASFTKPGQSATFTFYAINDGGYDAYLKTITFNSITGSTDTTGTKKCAYNSGVTATASLLSAACENINVKVKVGGDASTISYTDATSGVYTYSANHLLAKTANEEIVVTIEYTGEAVADGAFTVNFGDIELFYESTATA